MRNHGTQQKPDSGKLKDEVQKGRKQSLGEGVMSPRGRHVHDCVCVTLWLQPNVHLQCNWAAHCQDDPSLQSYIQYNGTHQCFAYFSPCSTNDYTRLNKCEAFFKAHRSVLKSCVFQPLRQPLVYIHLTVAWHCRYDLAEHKSTVVTTQQKDRWPTSMVGDWEARLKS